MWWAYCNDLEVEEFPKEVSENSWICSLCSLIDEEQEFDVWIMDLEPEKKRPPEDNSTVQIDDNLDNNKDITVRYAKDMPINDYQVITRKIKFLDYSRHKWGKESMSFLKKFWQF